jgi:hypothetical protein
MALFRRRSTSDEEPSADVIAAADPSTEQEQVVEDEPTGAVGGSDRSEGPFDETEADRADQSLPRLDLGSLLIPGLPGIGVQVEADPNTQEVRAVTGVGQEAAVQLQAFAAPRSEGIWEDIRAEMLAEISATDGARVTEHEGPFGPELRAVIPARSPEGKQVLQPLRFTGIDGPRWFIRAVFLGRAAVEPDPQDALHTLVRQTIVVRGSDARAPRDPLPLRLPEEPPQGMAPRDEADAEDVEVEVDEVEDEGEGGSRYADIDPFERGPEITEVR